MFSPAIPLGGYVGWKLFERTASRQFETFRDKKSLTRESSYFREKILKVDSAKEFVADRRLLVVALGAFGLEDEINKRAIIRRVIEEGAVNPDAFANRLSDPRWKAFAKAFDFSTDFGPPAKLASIQDDIVAKYLERSFERAVGESDTDFRLAMNFRREARAIAAGVNADRVGWFQILGQKPLRTIIESAFNLPTSFGNLDVDRQREIVEAKSEKMFGSKSPTVFLKSESIETMLRNYFVRTQLQNNFPSSASGAIALSLLSSSPFGAG